MAPSPVARLKDAAFPVKSKEVVENSTKIPTVNDSDDEDDTGDLAEQMNAQIRRRYVKGKKLGEGTYAIVYKGQHRTNPSKFVAIKKIKLIVDHHDGITMDAVREIKCLQELSHPNIIGLLAVFSTKDQNLNLVLEFLPGGDLEMMIRDRSIYYNLSDIKAWTAMLAHAVAWCHAHYILHRDIKPNNLLVAADGEVKLADFGLARSFADPYVPMTWNVITRWYRPPELFLRAAYYSGAVDVWSVGCVFAELVLRVPYMAGASDLQQMELICTALGTPTEQNWPGVSSLPQYDIIAGNTNITPTRSKQEMLAQFPTLGPKGVDLLMKMLALDPRKRSTILDALKHEWWMTDPKASNKKDLPKKGGENEMGQDLAKAADNREKEGIDKVARKLDFTSISR